MQTYLIDLHCLLPCAFRLLPSLAIALASV
jgi:hypothetical protein